MRELVRREAASGELALCGSGREAYYRGAAA